MRYQRILRVQGYIMSDAQQRILYYGVGGGEE
jgi:hypothetical protein